MIFILSIIGSCGTILNRGVTYLCFRNIYHNYIMIGEVGAGMEMENRIWSGGSVII